MLPGYSEPIRIPHNFKMFTTKRWDCMYMIFTLAHGVGDDFRQTSPVWEPAHDKCYHNVVCNV